MYRLNVKEMKSDGIGDLYAAFEQLKVKLAAKGLFDPAHKKSIPRYPGTIGIITRATPQPSTVRQSRNTASHPIIV